VSEGPDKGWGNGVVDGSIAVGIVLIAVFVAHQLRTAVPLLNLRLFADRLFRSATITLVLATSAFLGVLFLAALFFQEGLGLSALTSGLTVFPEALGIMIGAQVASRLLYPRYGPRRLMVGGLVVVSGAMALMSLIDNRGQLWEMRGLMLLLGLAMAHNFVPTQAAAFARISPADTGRASTIFNALRQLGGAVGVAILTSALAAIGVVHVVAGRSVPNLRAYHVAFLVAAGLALLAAAAATTIRDHDADSTRTPPPAHDERPEPVLIER
jgi:MFS family permease